jgi:hypothetical protein
LSNLLVSSRYCPAFVGGAFFHALRPKKIADARSCRFGLASAPIAPQFVHTKRGGGISAASAQLCQCRKALLRVTWRYRGWHAI